MPKISNEESRRLAASFINGIRDSLLVSVANYDNDQFCLKSSNGVPVSHNSPLQNYYGSSLQSNSQATCAKTESSCTNYRSNMMLSSSRAGDFISTDATFFTPRARDFTTKSVYSNDFNECIASTCNPDMTQLHNNSDSLNSKSKAKKINMADEKNSFRCGGNSSVGKYGKKCPKCFEINNKDANWCMECGKAIISVEIRRCESLEEENPNVSPPQYYESRSYPSHCYKNSISLDEDTIPNSLYDFVVKPPTFPASFNKVPFNQQKNNPVLFDFQNPQFEDECELTYKTLNKNAAIFHKNAGVGKKQDQHLYAFDDLLYPHYATQDPVYGYVLPSSNIFSNGSYLQSQVCADRNVYHQREARLSSNPGKFKSSKQQYKRKRKKVCLCLIVII